MAGAVWACHDRAVACGTPVIALRRRSVPEVIEDGISGFVVDTFEQAVTAVGRIASLDRAKVREAFERRFTAERMARDYVDIYESLIVSHAGPRRRRRTIRAPDEAPVTNGNQVLGPSELGAKSSAYSRPASQEAGSRSDIRLQKTLLRSSEPVSSDDSSHGRTAS